MADDIKTLEKDKAVKLWLQGREKWNKWVKKNPNYNIDFSGVDFAEESKKIKIRNNTNASDDDLKAIGMYYRIIDFSEFVFPNGDVDFSVAEFGNCGANFKKTNFGNGKVDFFKTNFGSGNINFSETNFGNGNINFSCAYFANTKDGSEDNSANITFSKATFGEGDVIFCDVKFDKGSVNFSETYFGNGKVDFSKAKLGRTVDYGKTKEEVNNYVCFIKANFCDGDVDFLETKFCNNVNFSRANFGNGNVSFEKAIFEGKNPDSREKIDFSEATFGDGDVIFNEAIINNRNLCFRKTDFGSGNINFPKATFCNGNIIFHEAEFGDCYLNFEETQFGESKLYLEYIKFKSGVYFDRLKNIQKLKSFSFKYSSFEGPLEISSDEVFPCIIDLTNTKTSHHVSLSGVNCRLPRKKTRESEIFPNGDWATQKIAIDPKDEERARRLKKLAEDNKDHDKAKDFFVLELQAKRKFKGIYGIPYGFLLNPEFWYEKLSDYGRSIDLPLKWFAGVWLTFGFLYGIMSCQFFKSLAYSAAQMLPFIPTSRNARESFGKELFGDPLPEWIYLPTFFQSLIALVLLFLLGLGLRHKFRI